MPRVSRVDRERDRLTPIRYARPPPFSYEEAYYNPTDGHLYFGRNFPSFDRPNRGVGCNLYGDQDISPAARDFRAMDNSGLRGHARVKKLDIPAFDYAMTNLVEELQGAEKFYIGFMDGHDSDMSSIKLYATLETVNGLWRSRVAGKTDPRNFPGDDQSQSAQKFTSQFENKRRALSRALDDAINTGIDGGWSHHSTRRLETARRLQAKISTAAEHILDLMDSAPMSRASCEALLEEVRSLKHTVDPEKTTKRTIYDQTEEGGEDNEGEREIDGGN